MRTLHRYTLVLTLIVPFLLSVGKMYADNSPLCFTARNGSVTVKFEIKNVTHTIQFSTDSTNWTNYWSNYSITLNPNQKIYFRAASNQTRVTSFGSTLDSSSRFYFTSSNGGKVESSGNIMSLYGPDCPTVLNYKAFAHLFYQCTLLTTAPDLPATSLSDYCYSYMFSGCTSLVTAPTLSSTLLAPGCYSSMFSGCTSLATAPSLPATTLAINCYYGMFRDCTSLTTAPSLPATTLVDECYYGMFYGCNSLTKVPTLSATLLGKKCYKEMFMNCTSLTAAPALPATILKEECYSSMFRGCASLISPPELPATTMVYDCYSAMFMDCESLLSSPSLPATTLAAYCYSCMFSGCTSLQVVPTLPATYLASDCYSSMFSGCASLQVVPTLPATYLASNCYSSMFSDCTSLIVNTSGPGKQWMISTSQDNTNPLSCMFIRTSGTMNGTPSGNTIYYIASCRHYVALNVSDTIMGKVDGEGSYIEGEQATFVATASSHYHFVGWNNGISTQSISLTVMNDTALTAFFEIDKHTITAAGDNGNVTGAGTYDYDSTITLTAIPNDHYYFARWSDGDTVNPRTITVNCDTTYTAIFEGNLHLITGIGVYGTVSGSGSYHYGTTATLTAKADEHYHFSNWSDGDTINPKIVTVTGDSSINAIFEIDKHSVSASGLYGLISGMGQYDYGSTATLFATAYNHYHFTCWSDGDTANPKTFIVNDDIAYNATFEIDKHHIDVVNKNGTITGEGTYNYGAEIDLIATADEHYHFVSWTDGDTSITKTIIVTCDTTYTAIFEIDKHTVTDLSVNGSVSGAGTFDYGTQVTLLAQPDEHYSFVSWSDGDTSATKTFVLTCDTSVTAIFELTKYTISATCEHGEVTGSGVYQYPDLVTLTVVPNDGYRFVKWDDENTYNPRVFVVEGDLFVEAICEEIPKVGVDDVEEDGLMFYVVGRIVYNPFGERLRVYSTSGKLVKAGNGDIELDGLPAGVYMVVNEKGQSLKMLITRRM